MRAINPIFTSNTETANKNKLKRKERGKTTENDFAGTIYVVWCLFLCAAAIIIYILLRLCNKDAYLLFLCQRVFVCLAHAVADKRERWILLWQSREFWPLFLWLLSNGIPAICSYTNTLFTGLSYLNHNYRLFVRLHMCLALIYLAAVSCIIVIKF